MEKIDNIKWGALGKELDKLKNMENIFQNENIDESIKIKFSTLTEDLNKITEKHKTHLEETKKKPVKSKFEPGWFSKFLASIIAFFATGYIKHLHQSFQSPELQEAVKKYKKSVDDYNKNYVNNPVYQEEFKKLGIKMPTVKYFLILATMLLACVSANAQRVYCVDYENQADVKVFVVKYVNQADLKVYIVKYANQAGNNDGKWFFTQYSNQAKKKIYFVKYKNQADLKIYFVDYENQAGWRKSSRQSLMY